MEDGPEEALSRAPGTGRRAELLDGGVVTIRRLLPSDAEHVIGLYESLDPDERYLRFFTMRPTDLPEWAQSTTECSETQCAIGCFESHELLGVANYVVSERPDVAEIAVTVTHGQHMRGVGTLLLHRLVAIAEANGVRRLVAQVLSANRPMLEVLSESGLPCHGEREGTLVNVTIDLSENP
nr:GNAT family N-acetyltransferase [Mycolicibacterium malmesburyense]CRL73846.1 N-acetyltransferase GCN5 [Mycolicibacterium malmesburyense]